MVEGLMKGMSMQASATKALATDWSTSWRGKIVAAKVHGTIQDAKSFSLVHTQRRRIGQLGSHHYKVGESGEPLATLCDQGASHTLSSRGFCNCNQFDGTNSNLVCHLEF